MPRKPRNFKSSWVWKPLDMDYIKVNVDDFFFESSGRGDIRGVFRDSEGKVILQFDKVSVNSPIHAEVLPLREGLLVVMASQ